MKFLFLTPYELEDAVENMVSSESLSTCEIGVSDDQDMIRIIEKDTFKEVPITKLLHSLGTYFGVHILTYDVMEVGDMGEGFAFQIK